MATTRSMRGFKRWMKCQGIECSDALHLSLSIDRGGTPSISVKALCDLLEGDVVATIPKQSCLTVKTSAASHFIEEAQLGGYLGLAVALMYERSLGPKSKWFQYLQLLPSSEPIPLLWSLSDIDSLLSGTEIHETLIASRSFKIDELHGSGMVPLADLFNHKTAAEDVHFTSVFSSSESDTDAEDGIRCTDDNKYGDDEHIAHRIDSEMGAFGRSDLGASSTLRNDSKVMQMIIVKDVKSGSEVFNTYGSLGNAALLHRYGFTEPDNPFDIVNMDLNIVLQWSSSVFSCRHSRRRLSLWRKLGYSGYGSENSQYFEISFDGEPQVELLVLLYIILLSEETYYELDLALLAVGNSNQITSLCLLGKDNFPFSEGKELNKKLLLTQSVRQALLSIANARDSLYCSNSVGDDIKSLNECCHETDRKLYHSLMLRISERRILEKLRSYAASGNGITRSRKRVLQA